jgi:hypothetical protein
MVDTQTFEMDERQQRSSKLLLPDELIRPRGLACAGAGNRVWDE